MDSLLFSNVITNVLLPCIAILVPIVINYYDFLTDPASVDLEKVANVIVEQSLRDATFSKEAGKMCYTIIQVIRFGVYYWCVYIYMIGKSGYYCTVCIC